MQNVASARAELAHELEEVQANLTTSGRKTWLSTGSARPQRHCACLPACARAAFVLTAAYAPAPDEGSHRRVALAAAMEMLYIALAIHKLLLAAPNDDNGRYTGNGYATGGLDGETDRYAGDGPLPASEPDRSLIGSTILTGDYCFSSAAQFAAQTDNPQVVTIFAETLQAVSEGQLRNLFNPGIAPYDDNRELIDAGIAAGAELSGFAPARRAMQAVAAALTAKFYDTGSDVAAENAVSQEATLSALPAAQRTRWQALATWLATQHAARQARRPD